MIPNIGLNNLPCGIVIINNKSIISDVNDVFCKWTGCDKTNLINKPLIELLNKASKILYLGHILPKLQNVGKVEEKYITLRTASEGFLPVLLNAEKGFFGDDIYFVIVVVRMLRRNLIEEQLILERQLAEKEKSEKEKINDKLRKYQKDLIEKQQELLKLNESLENISLTDPLTGLSNRRLYDREFDSCLKNFVNSSEFFTLILIDIDLFKAINDAHGHEMGDFVLKEVSFQLSQNLRKGDTLARIGGEEFALLLPCTSAAQGKEVAERYRKTIESSLGVPFKVTASFGVSEAKVGDTKTTLYNRVDSALYASKLNGRNCVTVI